MEGWSPVETTERPKVSQDFLSGPVRTPTSSPSDHTLSPCDRSPLDVSLPYLLGGPPRLLPSPNDGETREVVSEGLGLFGPQDHCWSRLGESSW